MARWSFSEHPASVGETYTEHMGSAWGFAARMAVGAVACFIHGLLPFLFTRTGSGIINELHSKMVLNRARQSRIDTLGSFESAAL
jgi:hypothetical protein